MGCSGFLTWSLCLFLGVNDPSYICLLHMGETVVVMVQSMSRQHCLLA